MKCPEMREKIAILADGLLDPSRQASAESHAKSCARCGEELRSARRLAALLRELRAEAPASLDARVLQASRRARSRDSRRGALPRLRRAGLSCQAALASLADHAGDVLPVNRRVDVDLHLDACPRCAAVFHRAHEIADVLEVSRRTAPAEIWDRLRPRIERIRQESTRRRIRPLLPAEGFPELSRLLPIGSAAAAALALVFLGPWLAHRLSVSTVTPRRRGPEIRFVFADRPVGGGVASDPLLQALLEGFHPLPPAFPGSPGAREAGPGEGNPAETGQPTMR